MFVGLSLGERGDDAYQASKRRDIVELTMKILVSLDEPAFGRLDARAADAPTEVVVDTSTRTCAVLTDVRVSRTVTGLRSRRRGERRSWASRSTSSAPACHGLSILSCPRERGAMDIGLLEVEGAIFHQVPRRPRGDAASAEAVVVSTHESKLEPRLKQFLRDRILGTFRESGQRVVRDDDAASPVPDLVAAALEEDPPEITERFAPLPALLHEVQAHNSPEGLFAVVRGRCGTDRVVVLLKVEQEKGLSFETATDDEGRVSIEVVIEEGLVLTSNTNVFKAAAFSLDEDRNLDGTVTDEQTGSVYRGPASNYWLTDFLGCKYASSVDVLTRSWVRAMERVIKSDIDDAADKDRAYTAMVAELGSNRQKINPKTFIRDYLPEPVQDTAVQRLRDAGASTASFTKSRAVANEAPRNKVFAFDNGVKVTMPIDVTPELTKETIGDQERDVLTIRGRLRSVIR